MKFNKDKNTTTKNYGRFKFDQKKAKKLLEAGVNITDTAKVVGVTPGSISRYMTFLQAQGALVSRITETEKADLTILGAKARKRISDRLDDDKEKVKDIPLVAIMDRTFQQRRLLDDKSTENVGISALLRQASDRERAQ